MVGAIRSELRVHGAVPQVYWWTVFSCLFHSHDTMVEGVWPEPHVAWEYYRHTFAVPPRQLHYSPHEYYFRFPYCFYGIGVNILHPKVLTHSLTHSLTHLLNHSLTHLLTHLQIQYNSKSADDDHSVGSESIGTTTSSLGVDSSSSSILNIRSILGELNLCEILQKLLLTYSLKLKKILETKKDLNFLGICLDILRRLLAALQGVVQVLTHLLTHSPTHSLTHSPVQKCRANKKRLHDLQVVDSLTYSLTQSYSLTHSPCRSSIACTCSAGCVTLAVTIPTWLCRAIIPYFPRKNGFNSLTHSTTYSLTYSLTSIQVQLLTKTARRIRYLFKEEDDEDDLSHGDWVGVSERVSEWVSEWVSQWVSEWVSEWVSK